MDRLIALNILAVAMSCSLVYWASAISPGPPRIANRSEIAPHLTRGNGCQIEVGGKQLLFQPGQGIETNAGWRNCQTYDGHSIVVYSSRPPKSAAMENDF